jgi:hypothetical protein
LGTDLQAVLDEKEELITERDAYKCKVHRLNHELNAVLKGDSKRLIDIDSLVMENRYCCTVLGFHYTENFFFKMFLGSRVWPLHRAAICELIV